jgi:hypothetical protein
MLLNNKLLAKLNDWAKSRLNYEAKTGGLINDKRRVKNKNDTV